MMGLINARKATKKIGNFAECIYHSTRQSGHSRDPEKGLYRVLLHWHSASKAHGIVLIFAVCQNEGTQQSKDICRVSFRLALGKVAVTSSLVGPLTLF